MVTDNEPIKSPQNPRDPPRKQSHSFENATKDHTPFSPRFKSVVAMAGWEEEALLIASLVVEDTSERRIKHNERSDLQNLKTPTNSRRYLQ